MLIAAQILLTILLSATDLVDVNVDDLSKAPRIRPLQDGLPLARLAPDHGRWVEADGTVGDAGIYLPSPLDDEYYRRLRACERLPDAFQVQLDGFGRKLRMDCTGRVETTAARCIAQRLDDDAAVVRGWTDWKVAVMVVASALFAGGTVALATLVSR